MKPNIGSADRALRVILGLGIIAYGIVNHTWLGAIGAVPLLTAFIRFCPLYAPLGINTVGKSGGSGGGCGCGGGRCGSWAVIGNRGQRSGATTSSSRTCEWHPLCQRRRHSDSPELLTRSSKTLTGGCDVAFRSEFRTTSPLQLRSVRNAG